MLPWYGARASRAPSIDDQRDDFVTAIAAHSVATSGIGTLRTGDFACRRRGGPHEKNFVVDVRCANPGAHRVVPRRRRSCDGGHPINIGCSVGVHSTLRRARPRTPPQPRRRPALMKPSSVLIALAFVAAAGSSTQTQKRGGSELPVPPRMSRRPRRPATGSRSNCAETRRSQPSRCVRAQGP